MTQFIESHLNELSTTVKTMYSIVTGKNIIPPDTELTLIDIYLSVYYGHFNIVKEIFTNYGVDFRRIEYHAHYKSHIETAIKRNNLEMVKYLMETYKIDVNRVLVHKRNSTTYINVAIKQDMRSIFDYLLSFKPKLQWFTSVSTSSICTRVEKAHPYYAQKVEPLIDADVWKQERNQNTRGFF